MSRMIKQTFKCQMCGEETENFARNHINCQKKYCSFCLNKRSRESQKRNKRKKNEVSSNDRA